MEESQNKAIRNYTPSEVLERLACNFKTTFSGKPKREESLGPVHYQQDLASYVAALEKNILDAFVESGTVLESVPNSIKEWNDNDWNFANLIKTLTVAMEFPHGNNFVSVKIGIPSALGEWESKTFIYEVRVMDENDLEIRRWIEQAEAEIVSRFEKLTESGKHFRIWQLLPETMVSTVQEGFTDRDRLYAKLMLGDFVITDANALRNMTKHQMLNLIAYLDDDNPEPPEDIDFIYAPMAYKEKFGEDNPYILSEREQGRLFGFSEATPCGAPYRDDDSGAIQFCKNAAESNDDRCRYHTGMRQLPCGCWVDGNNGRIGVNCNHHGGPGMMLMRSWNSAEGPDESVAVEARMAKGQLEITNVYPESVKEVKGWPDPTEDMLRDELFEAIWQAIKTWDINVPAAYNGYCGATGNHAR